jgi:methyltransferase (TIGR00027 family)
MSGERATGKSGEALDPVGTTALWVAAARARESARADRLFDDPFAARLAGPTGVHALALHEANGSSVPSIELRTRYLDDRLLAATSDGIDQVVVLAAGMDARAYRLPWGREVHVFEIDRAAVLFRKSALLAPFTACADRRAVALDLRDDWPAALRTAGFVESRPAAFLTEGLVVYLARSDVLALFARLDGVAAPGSVALFDVPGASFFESPWTRQWIEHIDRFGAPWVYGTDAPEDLLGPLGWDTQVTTLSDFGTKLGRWPFPAAPRETRGAPQSYLVQARKHGARGGAGR